MAFTIVVVLGAATEPVACCIESLTGTMSWDHTGGGAEKDYTFVTLGAIAFAVGVVGRLLFRAPRKPKPGARSR